jgi:UDP-4-amino-4,6-dideoxy-N-acetyl-beta-L-altrosamine transaminase
MPDRQIPYGRQRLDDDDVDAVVQALRSDFLTIGPRVAAFERDLERVTGAAHAVVLSSGTAALHAAYAAIGLGPGDEIITSPLTFAATANAALYLGARPVFVDVNPSTGNIDPGAVEAAITPATKAIVAVDFAGLPADYDALREIAQRHGLSLLSDAAHSLGATYRGRSVGTLADATTLSFHPVKVITTGEGGAVLTADPDLAERVRGFRSHGIVRDPARLRRVDGAWHHEMQSLGYNYRLTDLQAALGSSQLRKLDRFIERRRAIATRYQDAFAPFDSVMRPSVPAWAEPAWHLYVLRVAGDPARRRPFFEHLRAAGLGVQLHYIPVHLHPYYEDLGYRRGMCPIAEDFSARSVSIPIFPGLTDDDVEYVVVVVSRAIEEVVG